MWQGKAAAILWHYTAGATAWSAARTTELIRPSLQKSRDCASVHHRLRSQAPTDPQAPLSPRPAAASPLSPPASPTPGRRGEGALTERAAAARRAAHRSMAAAAGAPIPAPAASPCPDPSPWGLGSPSSAQRQGDAQRACAGGARPARARSGSWGCPGCPYPRRARPAEEHTRGPCVRLAAGTSASRGTHQRGKKWFLRKQELETAENRRKLVRWFSALCFPPPTHFLFLNCLHLCFVLQGKQ